MKSLGDRMKENYENRSRYKLSRRIPVIIRLDGKAFHTVTKHCEKPFDEQFNNCMLQTADYLMKNIQGAKLAYVQSDEISILVTDYTNLNTDAWFDYNLQKMTSISAGMASAVFSKLWTSDGVNIFDSRAFNIPKEDVNNYFVWRQQDWLRNSIQMLGQAHFSHQEMQCKNASNIHEMLHTKDINWADLHPKWKNGTTLQRDDRLIMCIDDHMFSKDLTIIDQYL